MTQGIPQSQTFEFHGKERPYAVIIGVYNEGAKFTRQLSELQPFRAQADVIIADGNSTDGATSADALKGNARTLIINTDAQRGLSVQYRIALNYALQQGYKGVIMVDGNGKDGMDAVPKFIAKLEEGYDFLQGSRFLPGGEHKNTPIDRVIGIRLVFNPIMNIASRFWYTDAINGYKACNAAFLSDPRVQPFRSVFTRYNLQYYVNYIAPRLKFRVAEIPVSRNYPNDGQPYSKIVGVGARIKILRELFETVTGKYNIK